MTCDAVRDRLVLWADDDLPAQEALAVRAHLAECPACAAVRREVERLTAELHGEPLPAVPEGLRDRIGLALDAVDGSRFAGARRRSPWETAAFYLAAAAVIALVFGAAAFLSQSGTGVRVAQTPTTPVPLPQPSVPTTSAPPALAPAAAAPTPAGEQQAVAEAIKKLEEAQRKRELANRERALLGSSPPPAGVREPTTGPGSGKPPGTLAAGGAGPEELRTPTRPVAIELSFVPPEHPATDETANGLVEITARQDVPNATVTATGDEGLTVDKPGGVLYRGPLRAGETVRVPLPLTATTPGSHEVNLKVEADTPSGNAELKVFIPGVAGRPAPKPPADAGERTVSLVFQNAPIRQALMDVARQGRLRMEMAEGLGAERISRDVRGVPARAAFRAIAEAGGYEVTERDGVFHVARRAGAR